MLPDLSRLKKDVRGTLERRFRSDIQKRMGFMGTIKRICAYESNRMRIHRQDGTFEDIAMVQATAEMTVHLPQIARMTLEDRDAKFSGMAQTMADNMSRGFFESLDAGLANAGRTINAAGRPIDAELVLEVLESMDMEFDEHGNQRDAVWVFHPSQEQ